MRSHLIVLLAAFINDASAGPVRRHRNSVRYSKFARFFNESSSIASTTEDPSTLTSLMTPPTTTLASADLSLDITISEEIPLITTQLGPSELATSIPSSISSIAAASFTSSTEEALSAVPSATSYKSYASTSPAPASLAAEPTSSDIGSLVLSSGGTGAPVPAVSASASQPSISSSLYVNGPTSALTPVSSASPTVDFEPPSNIVFPSITGVFSSYTPSSTVIYPTATGDNKALAAGFNSIYRTLDMTSRCNAGDQNQATVCVDGELAQCQNDGLYVLKSCPQGQSCYALPLAADKNGIYVSCAVPSDAASQLSVDSSSSPSTVISQAAVATFQPVSSSVLQSNEETSSESAQPTSSLIPATVVPTTVQPEKSATPTDTSPLTKAGKKAAAPTSADSGAIFSIPNSLNHGVPAQVPASSISPQEPITTATAASVLAQQFPAPSSSVAPPVASSTPASSTESQQDADAGVTFQALGGSNGPGAGASEGGNVKVAVANAVAAPPASPLPVSTVSTVPNGGPVTVTVTTTTTEYEPSPTS